MGPYHIRSAESADSPAIQNIYAPYVRDTIVTFEYTVPCVNEMRDRLGRIAEQYPYLVCLYGHEVIGYAYAHRHMERAAYQWNAELSVYIAKNHQGGGLGTKLYRALMAILKLQNVKNVYGCVTLPNPGSEKLHDALGFTRCALYPKAGYKCGEWHDVAWFEKSIAGHLPKPAPFLPLPKISKEKITAILDCTF